MKTLTWSEKYNSLPTWFRLEVDNHKKGKSCGCDPSTNYICLAGRFVNKSVSLKELIDEWNVEVSKNIRVWLKENIINYNGLTDKEQSGVAFFVNEGYTQGRIDNLEWKLNMQPEDNLKDIVNMIQNGFTEGYRPEWSLTFKRK